MLKFCNKLFVTQIRTVYLQKCSKNKDATRLQLLLTYLQNGIEEPWQRIPSVIALFAAEASLILMDPSHDHYPTLTKVLMHSSRVNLKVHHTCLMTRKICSLHLVVLQSVFMLMHCLFLFSPSFSINTCLVSIFRSYHCFGTFSGVPL